MSYSTVMSERKSERLHDVNHGYSEGRNPVRPSLEKIRTVETHYYVSTHDVWGAGQTSLQRKHDDN